MNSKEAIERLIQLGPLPTEDEADTYSEEQFSQWEVALGQVERPITDEDASALSQLFPSGEDSCYGLAWTLAHLVESAPGWSRDAAQRIPSEPWRESLVQAWDNVE